MSELSKALGNVTIVKKGPDDLIACAEKSEFLLLHFLVQRTSVCCTQCNVLFEYTELQATNLSLWLEMYVCMYV